MPPIKNKKGVVRQRGEALTALFSNVEREVRKMATDLADKVRNLEVLPWENLSRDTIVRDAKRNLEDFAGEVLDRFNARELAAKARCQADQAKDHILSLLSIPTQDEMGRLSRKVKSLEKRVNAL